MSDRGPMSFWLETTDEGKKAPALSNVHIDLSGMFAEKMFISSTTFLNCRFSTHFPFS
jgi:hypothetical protein